MSEAQGESTTLPEPPLEALPEALPESDPAPPPAGWYPDPDDTAKRRWWTGTEWGPSAPAEARGRSVRGHTAVPIGMFAVGFMLAALAVILLFTNVTADGRDCGSVIGAGPAVDMGSPAFQGFNATLCTEAQRGRVAVCILMGLAGAGLIGGSFLVDRRPDGDADTGPGADPGADPDAG